MCVKSGDLVKWMLPLDPDYSYGKIIEINRGVARVRHIGGYYDGKEIEVHLRYIIKEGKESGGKTKRRRK